MANPINPNGLSPVRNGAGGYWNQQANPYFIPLSDGNQYNIGDIVKSVAAADANGLPGVTKANAGDTPRGVIVGVFVVPPNGPISLVGSALSLELTNIPATKVKNYYVMIVDDPAAIFEIQDDGLTLLTATSANKNVNFTVANPVSPQQQSGTVLNTSTVATSASLPLKMMGLAQRYNNSFGIYARWLVKFNQHELLGNTAGV